MTEGSRNRPRGAESERLNFLPPALPSESPSSLPVLSQSSSVCSSARRPMVPSEGVATLLNCSGNFFLVESFTAGTGVW